MSLVAWYPLIDGSLENKGLDTTPLTLHGTVPFSNGRVRTAPTFSANSSNYYTMPPITKTNDFSVCLWFKFDNLARIQYLFWQGDANVESSRLSVAFGSPTQEFVFHFGNVAEWRLLKNQLEANKWYHLCVTIDDSGFCHTYFNGENIYDTTIATTIEPIETLLFRFNSPYTMDGQLQDFRYYDHCLSPKEVKEIARGLCLHLPLKGIGAQGNLFKKSAVMFDVNGGLPVSTTCTKNPVRVFDENAPCGVNGKILRATISRPDTNTNTAGGYFYSTAVTGIPTLTVGAKYCVSVWARTTANNIHLDTVSLMEGHTRVASSDNNITSEWKRFYSIFTATKETSTTCLYIVAPVGADGILELCCPKMEVTYPTPYIPHNTDTQYDEYDVPVGTDCSGNGFNGTNTSGVTTRAQTYAWGRYNASATFNGTTGYIQGQNPLTTESTEFSISTWVVFYSTSVTQSIFNSRTVMGSGIAFFFMENNYLRLDDGGVATVFPGTTFSTNRWYHVVVTRTATEKKCYINGTLVSTQATSNTLVNVGDTYAIGASSSAAGEVINNNYLQGRMSDLRVYTSVLSADDIKELYETSASIDNNGNLHTYEFDEGLQASITKTGIHNATTLTEATKTSIQQNNTDTVTLKEN